MLSKSPILIPVIFQDILLLSRKGDYYKKQT